MTVRCSRAPAWCGRWRARRCRSTISPARTGAKLPKPSSRRCGRPNARRCRNSPTASSTSSPACLLPIWDRLPSRNMRVYRFETDEGERVIGRLVAPEELGRLYQSLGAEAPALSAAEAWSAVLDRGAVIDLAGGLQLRRSLSMGAHTGRTDRLRRGRHGQHPEIARSRLGDHRLAPAAVRAGVRRRARRSSPRCSPAIRCSPSARAPTRPDPDMTP